MKLGMEKLRMICVAAKTTKENRPNQEKFEYLWTILPPELFSLAVVIQESGK